MNKNSTKIHLLIKRHFFLTTDKQCAMKYEKLTHVYDTQNKTCRRKKNRQTSAISNGMAIERMKSNVRI